MITKQPMPHKLISNNMKKNLFTITTVFAVVFTLGNTALAQTTTPMKSVAVNVDLREIVSIGQDVVDNGAINFVYASANDYNNDQTIVIPKQVSVTSTKTYDLVVKTTAAAEFSGVTSPVDKLLITLLKVSAKTAGSVAAFPAGISPAIADATLLAANPASLSQSFDISYTIAKNPALFAAKKQVYTTGLTYSVTTQ